MLQQPNFIELLLHKEMPNLRISVACFDFLYEAEAREILGELFEFSKTPALCFELAELYKFGHSREFRGLLVPIDLCKAAYWYIKSAAYGSKAAFDFFYRMVPECFLEGISQTCLFSAVIETLIEQAKWSCHYSNETIEERKQREHFEGCGIDMVLYPEEHGLDKDFWFDFLRKQCPSFAQAKKRKSPQQIQKIY